VIDFDIVGGVNFDLEEDEREAVICWMSINACSEMLNVDECVMKKSVSMCLLILHNRTLETLDDIAF